MRVSVVTPFHLPRVSGMTTYVQRVADGLAGAGHDVEVLTTQALTLPRVDDGGSAGPPVEVVGGITIRRFPLARRAHRGLAAGRRVQRRVVDAVPGRTWDKQVVRSLDNGPISPRLALEVQRALLDRDVVIGAAFPYLTTVAVGLGRPRRARVVALPLFHSRPGLRLTPAAVRALDRCDVLVGLTRVEVHDLAARGVRRPGARVIPPGCAVAVGVADPETARASLGLPAGPTVGFVGRLAVYKGLDTLVDALAALVARHPGVHVLVAGVREPWDDLDPVLARAAGVVAAAGGRLSLVTGFAEEERPGLLAACDVVVTPSREESYGMVNIEAMAAGRPVVAADIPAVREVVREGIDGLLVPPGDPGALAAAVASLLDDPDRSRSTGAAGRARVERDHRWDDVVARWLDVVVGG